MGRRLFILGTYLSYFHRNGKRHKGWISGNQYGRIRGHECFHPVKYLCVCIPLIHKASSRRQNPHKPANFALASSLVQVHYIYSVFVYYSRLHTHTHTHPTHTRKLSHLQWCTPGITTHRNTILHFSLGNVEVLVILLAKGKLIREKTELQGAKIRIHYYRRFLLKQKQNKELLCQK